MKNKRDRKRWKRYFRWNCISVAIMSIGIMNVKTLARDSRNEESSVHFLYCAAAENREETEYEYDDLNRVVKAVYPDGTVVLYEYDKNGNLLKTTVVPPEDSEQTGADSEEAGTSAEGTTEAGGQQATENSAKTGSDADGESGNGSGEGDTDGKTGSGSGESDEDGKTGSGSGESDADGKTGSGSGGSNADGKTGTGSSEGDTDGKTGTGNDESGTDSTLESDTDDETEIEEGTGQGKHWLTIILGAAGAAVVLTLISFLHRKLRMKENTKEEGEEEHEK